MINALKISKKVLDTQKVGKNVDRYRHVDACRICFRTIMKYLVDLLQ